ncbi:hypothetical protein Xbed_03209 [Xenorhabdus beddingii]|uniref:Uncharacterized protein n=1 Tax=Xenorhabdus beddingii TaxID=40578 RepID=A0A1Y2SH47_9GAMM|nr:DUF1435 family protein [Xenorhabdus beddingii]OTA18140.1 hypothetical protein Xbed_03209 [Xenorhabdus beddingii]
MMSSKRNLKRVFWQSITGFWGMLLFSLIVSASVVSALIISGAGIAQFKFSIQGTMLLTLLLLSHHRARHFLLIPAGITVMCSLLSGFHYFGYF